MLEAFPRLLRRSRGVEVGGGIILPRTPSRWRRRRGSTAPRLFRGFPQLSFYLDQDRQGGADEDGEGDHQDEGAGPAASARAVAATVRAGVMRAHATGRARPNRRP